MTNKQAAILLMFALCSGFALVWGLIQANSARDVILDYRVTDLGARSLLHHGDLYSESVMMRVYADEDANQLHAQNSTRAERYLGAVQVYPPTAELVFAPFALLPWRFSYALWIGVTIICMTVAVFVMWQVAYGYSADLPFYLGCIVLCNSGILFSGGNSAGLAVSLCVIGVWCILQQRFAALGVVFLVLSLAIKPHDSGFIWLYLLLLGGSFRKRAVQCLIWLVPIGAVSVAWVWQVSPHWITELRSNVAQMSSGGLYNDPAGSVTPLMVHLQAAIATFNSNPRVYNLIAYAICVPLFAVWLVLALRRPLTREGIWLGLAAIAALSLLPVYHRPYDAKILVLTFPACAALWTRRGPVAWMAIAFTYASILITSDFPIAALYMLKPDLPPAPGVGQKIAFLLAVHPASIILSATGVFYLWAFHRSFKLEPSPAGQPEPRAAQLQSMA